MPSDISWPRSSLPLPTPPWDSGSNICINVPEYNSSGQERLGIWSLCLLCLRGAGAMQCSTRTHYNPGTSASALCILSLFICKRKVRHLLHRGFIEIECDIIFANSASNMRYLKEVDRIMHSSLRVSKRVEDPNKDGVWVGSFRVGQTQLSIWQDWACVVNNWKVYLIETLAKVELGSWDKE